MRGASDPVPRPLGSVTLRARGAQWVPPLCTLRLREGAAPPPPELRPPPPPQLRPPPPPPRPNLSATLIARFEFSSADAGSDSDRRAPCAATFDAPKARAPRHSGTAATRKANMAYPIRLDDDQNSRVSPLHSDSPKPAYVVGMAWSRPSSVLWQTHGIRYPTDLTV